MMLPLPRAMHFARAIGVLLLVFLWVGRVGGEVTPRVGVMWIEQSAIADEVLVGLQLQLADRAPQVKLEVRPALASVAEAEALFARWQDEMQGIVFLRSSGAEFLAKHPSHIPAFVGACTHPTLLGAIQDVEAPEGNITGTSYFIPPALHLELYREVYPGLKTVGLILESGHAASVIEQQETEKACAALGIACHTLLLNADADVREAIAPLAPTVDLIVLGNMAGVIRVTDKIAEAAGSTPVASFSEIPVRKGHAMMGLVADNEKTGRRLADAVIEVVVNTRPVHTVAVMFDEQPKILRRPSAAAQTVNPPRHSEGGRDHPSPAVSGGPSGRSA